MREAGGGSRVGVDVGGTFTDVARHDGTGWRFAKTLTTPANPSEGILGGIDRVTGPDAYAGIRALVHGTTLVPNALIERKGARTGLITTAGFRDVLEIGREPRYDPFDLGLDKPAPLVPRAWRLEVRERVRADGAVVVPLCETTVRAAARSLREAGCEAVAVVLMHAFRNPAHEARVGEILAAEFPDLDVSLSSRVSPEIGEFVRASTTAANAYVRPLVRRYVTDLMGALRRRGCRGEVLLMQSHGAAAPPEIAIDLPIRLIESGTAAGAIAAAAQGVRCGELQLVSFDMGGTTAKICVVDGGQPSKTSEVEVARLRRFKKGSGLPLRVPVVEMLEIGAGGGSIAGIDGMGLLGVGPESAGADPGPACYGRGGRRATVTDADLVLGYLDPDYFLGGEMTLEPPAARAAIAAGIADPLGVDVVTAAKGIVDVVNSHMATAIRLHTIERGGDPARYALFAFGGAGPVHAYELARRVGLPRVICPPHAGVASAVGLLIARPAAEAAASRYTRLDRPESADVRALLARLEAEARAQLARMGVPGDVTVTRLAEMCYVGQGHHIPVVIPGHLGDGPDLAGVLGPAFEAAYRRTYGRTLPDRPIEALTWRVTVATGTDAAAVELLAAEREAGPALKGERRAYFPEVDGFLDCPVYERMRLASGERLRGPAILEERESTIVVGPSGQVRVDDLLNVVMDLDAVEG